MSQKIRFNIQRYNPKKDKKPYFQEYEVDVDPWQTVLEGLINIRNNLDTSLAFRMSCKSGICGSCALRINGRACLACKTKIKDEVSRFGEVSVEPLGNLEIQKDLMVDLKPLYEEMKAIKPWFKTLIESDNEIKVSPDAVKKIEKSAECIWCAACFSDCPSREYDEKYLGPAASVLAHRYIFDIRNEKKRERLKKVVNKHIWMCAHCERSTENCPQDIAPQEIISQLREESIKEGLIHNDGARHARTIERDIKKYGEVFESRLPIKTFGLFRVLKELPAAIKLIIKGKLPPLFIKKIRDHDEIKQLSKDVERTAKEKNDIQHNP